MTPVAPPPLRPVVDADGPGLAALIAACFAEYDGCLFEPTEFPELDAIARHVAAADGRMWVAEAEGALVASLGARPAGADAVELLKVYVARPWRGTGLADALLAAAAEFARARDARRLELWSDTRFTRAHAFYVKNGFVRTGETRFLDDVSRSWEARFVRAPVTAPSERGSRRG
jgi:putative acetyltransferase